ncbi:unnamed protein product [marine sediment metagenome]|uniref:Beta-lactamase-related domain-containing protein n=1 Tax=marine sediment metagenome TaxID=412755 RepID=X1I5U9_9ZZZZ
MIPISLRLGKREYVIKGYGWGLGSAVLVDVAQSEAPGSEGQYMWAGGANTYFWVDPKEEMIGLLMAQFIPVGYYPIEGEFKALAYQAIVD